MEKSKNISLYGTEVQIVRADKEIINEYLSKVNSEVTITEFKNHIWQSHSMSDLANHMIDIQRLDSDLNQNRNKYIARSSSSEFEEIKFHQTALKNYLTLLMQDYEEVKHDLRDIYMASNISATMEITNLPKYIYWAHNSHVGKDQSNGPADVAGRELNKQFGEKYFTIKSDFGFGTFLAYPHNANEIGWDMDVMSYGEIDSTTITYCIHSLMSEKAKVAIVDVVTAVSNSREIFDYFSDFVSEMNGAGSQARKDKTSKIKIYPSFDAIIYFKESSPINFMSQD